MTRVIAVMNLKGGVGKTTLAVNLAAGLANRTNGTRNHNVLLVDLDPQASATAYMLGENLPDPEHNFQTALSFWLQGKQDSVGAEDITGRVRIPNPIFSGAWPNLHLLQSYPGSRNVEIEPFTRFARKEDVLREKKHYRIIGYLLQEIVRDYDYVFFDCPPHYNWITAGAVIMSDDLIVPVIPDFLSTNGLSDLVTTLGEDIAMLAPDHGKRIRAIALMLSDGNTVHSQFTASIRNEILPGLRKESKHARELLEGCEIWDGLSRRAGMQKLIKDFEAVVSRPADDISRVELETILDLILRRDRTLPNPNFRIEI